MGSAMRVDSFDSLASNTPNFGLSVCVLQVWAINKKDIPVFVETGL
jgi:hypothetical protein